jgi:hypothetical protein
MEPLFTYIFPCNKVTKHFTDVQYTECQLGTCASIQFPANDCFPGHRNREVLKCSLLNLLTSERPWTVMPSMYRTVNYGFEANSHGPFE